MLLIFLVKVKYFHHVHLANENLQAAMKTRNVNYDFLKKCTSSILQHERKRKESNIQQ